MVVWTVVLISLVGLALAVILAGLFRKRILHASFPAEGQLVDVGGCRLHYRSLGEGQPVVVLDAGAGEFGLMWYAVQKELASSTRVVSYDRAGLGWSDPSPRSRTNVNMVEELRSLLKNAAIPGPYILVGASLGGLNMKLFAHQYPQDVAGLVLVDAAHEEQFLPQPLQDAMQRMSGMAKSIGMIQKFLISSGLAALFPRLVPMALPDTLPAEVRLAYRAVRASDTRNTVTAQAELAAVSDSHAMIRAEGIQSLWNLPLIVIRHGRFQAQMMAEISELMETTNQRLQEQTAGLSTNSQLIVAENSGHDIVADQPDLVIGAIRALLAQVQATSTPYRGEGANLGVEINATAGNI